MVNLADQGCVFYLQLVTIFELTWEIPILLDLIEKSPSQTVITAAAVTYTEQKSGRPGKDPAGIWLATAQVASFTCSAITWPLESSTVNINGIWPMAWVAQLRQGS